MMPDNTSKKILEFAEKAVRLHVDGGMSPDDAVFTVSKEGSLSPAYIARVSEGFNLSSAVAHLAKSSFADKKASHPLVNAREVTARLYGEPFAEKSAEAVPVPVEVPNLTFDRPRMEKWAAISRASIPPSVFKEHYTVEGVRTRMEKCAEAQKSVLKNYREKEAAIRLHIEDLVEALSKDAMCMLDEEFIKCARLVVNGYGERGQQFVNIIANRARKSTEGLKRTASTAVFPLTPFFSKVAHAQELRLDYTKARRDREDFEAWTDEQLLDAIRNDNIIFGVEASKATTVDELRNMIDDVSEKNASAVGVSSTFLPSYALLQAADSVEQVGDLKRLLGSASPAPSVLNPETIHTLRETEARRNFLQLLYAPELKDRSFAELVEAYNDVVQVAPEISSRPGMLRIQVVDRLNAGLQDPYKAQAMTKDVTEVNKLQAIRERQLSDTRERAKPSESKRDVLTRMVAKKPDLDKDKPKASASDSDKNKSDAKNEKAKNQKALEDKVDRLLFKKPKKGDSPYAAVQKKFPGSDLSSVSSIRNIAMKGFEGESMSGDEKLVWEFISSKL